MATMAPPSAAAFCFALILVSLPGAHPAPVPQTTGPSSSCTNDLFRLLSCLPFVNGAVAVPPETCCANLGSMVHDEPLCLCQAIRQYGSGTSQMPVNISRVLELPRLCQLNLPSVDTACAGLLPVGPAPSPPVVSPHPSANSTVPPKQTPVTPTPPQTTGSPGTSSQQSGYSSGSKLMGGGISVALGFMALASALAF